MQVRGSDPWVELYPLVIGLIGIFVYTIGLVKREGCFSFAPPIFHLFLTWLDIVARIHDGPPDACVLGREVRVLRVLQTTLMECVTWSIIRFLGTEQPLLLGGLKLLLQHGSGVGTLRPVTVDENVTHI